MQSAIDDNHPLYHTEAVLDSLVDPMPFLVLTRDKAELLILSLPW